jgi:hypothetical protein
MATIIPVTATTIPREVLKSNFSEKIVAPIKAVIGECKEKIIEAILGPKR